MVSQINLQSGAEIHIFGELLDKVKDVKGDCIEVGVYHGYSAQKIAEHKGDKKLYLYDTFENFPDVKDEEKFMLDQFNFEGAYDRVISLGLPNTEVIKGVFPDCAIDSTFSFAHIDVDTYNSTLKSLEYIYPRMAKGGIIVLHDYTHSKLQVKKAVRDFNADLVIFTCDTSQAFIWI